MDCPNRGVFLLFFFFFLLCFFLLVVVPEKTLAADNYLAAPYVNCLLNTTAGTSLSSTFKHNLNTALQNLTSAASVKGLKYANISAGSGDDKVYAIFQCRGDLTPPLCSQCVANATVRLPQHDCPASIGARIQLDGCYLRYDNQSFLSPDFKYVIGLCSTANTSDSVALTAIYSLVQNVTTLAPKEDGFASASADGMYAAAQCLGYLTESECSQCLSTTPYRTVCDSVLGEQVHLTSCYYRFEAYRFFEIPSSPPPAAPAPSLPPATPQVQASAVTTSHNGSKTPIIAAGISVAAIISLCIILVWRYKASKKTDVGKKQVERQASWQQPLVQTKAKMFSLQELEEATRHFHPDTKLGEGGYGSVYKGILSRGETVAIKKLSSASRQGRQEFLNEVNLITRTQHKNLIRLIGCCVEGSERILVYEYLPNKSLDSMLFGDQRDGKTLDWPTRYGIVLGVAKGLAYLHEESHIRIIHRDIKPSNILLDNQLNAVIADFGLARLVEGDETHINTRVAGTLGYLAPEYAMHGELSEKTDVFSFGLVCLEILSGKESINNRLLELAWRLYVQKKILDLIDTKLVHAFSVEQVIRIVHIALLSTQENPKQRPTMSTIVLLLSGKSEILEIPQKPAFVEMSELSARGDTANYQSSSASSDSSTSCIQNSITTHSHTMSNAADSATSEIVEPR